MWPALSLIIKNFLISALFILNWKTCILYILSMLFPFPNSEILSTSPLTQLLAPSFSLFKKQTKTNNKQHTHTNHKYSKSETITYKQTRDQQDKKKKSPSQAVWDKISMKLPLNFFFYVGLLLLGVDYP